MSREPMLCDTRIETPVPIPKKMHRRTSTGCELVPTAAREVLPQKLPITRVSTVVYSCCSTFPRMIGIANRRTFFMIGPVVISIFFVFNVIASLIITFYLELIINKNVNTVKTAEGIIRFAKQVLTVVIYKGRILNELEIIMNDIIIRKMHKADSEEVLAMMKIFYASPALLTDPSEDVMKRDIEDCLGDNPFIECFVFEDKDNNIAGYSMVAHSYSTECGGNCIWVEDIYIKPDYRGKHIAGSFFDYLDGMYKGKAVRMRLEVEEENESAVKAYRKAGFDRLGYVQMSKEYSE